jgi:hypothetical protein
LNSLSSSIKQKEVKPIHEENITPIKEKSNKDIIGTRSKDSTSNIKEATQISELKSKDINLEDRINPTNTVYVRKFSQENHINKKSSARSMKVIKQEEVQEKGMKNNIKTPVDESDTAIMTDFNKKKEKVFSTNSHMNNKDTRNNIYITTDRLNIDNLIKISSRYSNLEKMVEISNCYSTVEKIKINDLNENPFKLLNEVFMYPDNSGDIVKISKKISDVNDTHLEEDKNHVLIETFIQKDIILINSKIVKEDTKVEEIYYDRNQKEIPKIKTPESDDSINTGSKEVVSNKEKKINKEEKSDRKKERNIVKNLREKVTDFHSFGNFSQIKDKQNFSGNYKSDYQNVKEVDRKSCLEIHDKKKFDLEKKDNDPKETHLMEDNLIIKQEKEARNVKLDLIANIEEKNKVITSQQDNNITVISDKEKVQEERKNTKNNLDSVVNKGILVEPENQLKIIEKLENEMKMDKKNNTKDINLNREKFNEEIKNDNKNFEENKLFRSDLKSDELKENKPTDIKNTYENINVENKTQLQKENSNEDKKNDNLNKMILEKEENPLSQQNQTEIEKNTGITTENIENHQACPESHEIKATKVESKDENCNIIENCSLEPESQKPKKAIKLDEKDHIIKAETPGNEPISSEECSHPSSNEKKETNPKKFQINKERALVKISDEEMTTSLEPSSTSDVKPGSIY